ncbi:MAG: plastocyanin/azurin family copper-binding protein [Bdellovibrionota bacterium]
MKFLSLLLLISFAAEAKNIKLVQGGKTFLSNVTDDQAANAYDDPQIEEKYKVEELSAKVGDEITFQNRDEVAHNVSGSKSDKVTFDVKLQEPGKANDRNIKLTDKGDYVIQCAIHPKMKIKLKVE